MCHVYPVEDCLKGLPFISSAKVFKMLQEMPTSKATGTDSIGVQLLKIAASGIAEPMSRLINRCISTRNFLSKWKIAKVTPVFKNQGSKNDKQNYRPISVLPILSKIFERHMYDIFYTHLSRNSLLYGLQSAFRKKHSTETALIRLLDRLLFDVDNNNVSGLVCVDYGKTFDLINHELLITKLRAYDIDDSNLRLFQSYLSNRKQYVAINGYRSSLLSITHGVKLTWLPFCDDVKINKCVLLFAPCKGIRIPESRNFLLVESGILGFGIRNPALRIRNPT